VGWGRQNKQWTEFHQLSYSQLFEWGKKACQGRLADLKKQLFPGSSFLFFNWSKRRKDEN
jgi:hypothetical protein